MEPEKPRSRRPFYNKVRTGCQTCKIRKVKCDEAKPHCRRCVATGRECDGYRPPTERRAPSFAAAHLSSTSASPGNLISHSALFASSAERRSFYYFQMHASKPLAGYFNTSFWGREIMQAAIHYEPVRHLVIALGAAYESMECINPADGSPGVQRLPQQKGPADNSQGGMEFALQQCNRSIRQLSAMPSHGPSSYKSVEATCCLLAASVLFIYLAIIRLEIGEAFQHIQSAVKVLRDFEKSLLEDSNSSKSESSRSTSPDFPVPFQQLRTVITSLYGQLRVLSNDVFVTEVQHGGEDFLVSDIKPATIFVSLAEAHVYVERLLHNTLAYLQQTELNPPDREDAEGLARVVSRHKELCDALDSSWVALDMLSSSLSVTPGATTASDRQAEKDGLIVLRLYHLLLSVRLRIDVFRPESRESAFDDLEAHLEEMLGLCEILAANQKRQPEQPICSSGLGYVMPLHTVAARCRNPELRRRALHLLLTGTRRDGIWDSRLTGQIASHTLAIEEAEVERVGVAVPDGDRRVREVKVQLEGERTARLRFITVEDWKRGYHGTERVIKW